MTEKAMTAEGRARKLCRDIHRMQDLVGGNLKVRNLDPELGWTVAQEALDAHVRDVRRETVEKACQEVCRRCGLGDEAFGHSYNCTMIRAAFPEESDR